MSHIVIVPNHEQIRNFLNHHRLPLYFSKPALQHITEYIAASTAKGFRGKVVDIAEYSDCHRTTIGHFLSDGKWDESYLQRIVKEESLRHVVQQSKQTKEPIFVIHDDTVCKKTKPSLQAVSPIEQTDFHYSHLDGTVVFGHQVQATMIQCADTTWIHEIRRYDKAKTKADGTAYTKIDEVCDIADTMPTPPHKGYALVDAWYTCPKVINRYAKAGYHLVGALKTNRILYPKGIRMSIQTFASHITRKDVRLVTVNGSAYWVYRYEGALNGIENAVVLLCWPKEAFQNPKALRAFLCTDVSLETETIVVYYSKRWPIEIFFRQSKGNLGFETYQVRSEKAFTRLWVLLSFTHLYCTIGLGKPYLFGDGLRRVRKQVKIDYVRYVYECGRKGIQFTDVLTQLKLA